MKTVDHFFENNIYLIKNCSVARNPLFKNKYYRKRFLDKMEFYLSPLCQILHYVIDVDQYQILIKLADRERFITFFKMKTEMNDIPHVLIPPSTHILSQVISNLQSSAAIHFNRKEGRSGALFGQRFKKELVENQIELEQIISQLNSSKRAFNFSVYWRFKRKRRDIIFEKGRKGFHGLSGRVYYDFKHLKHYVLSTFIRVKDLDLHGQFENLPPTSIYHTDWTVKSLSKRYFITFPP